MVHNLPILIYCFGLFADKSGTGQNHFYHGQENINRIYILAVHESSTAPKLQDRYARV